MDTQVRRFNRFVYKIAEKKLGTKIKHDISTINIYKNNLAYLSFARDAATSLENNTKKLKEIRKLKRTPELYNKMKKMAFLSQIIVMPNRVIFETQKVNLPINKYKKKYILRFGKFHLILYSDGQWRAKRVNGALQYNSHEHQHIEGSRICWTHNDRALGYIRDAVMTADLDIPMCFFWNLINRWDNGNAHISLRTAIKEIGKEVK